MRKSDLNFFERAKIYIISRKRTSHLEIDCFTFTIYGKISTYDFFESRQSNESFSRGISSRWEELRVSGFQLLCAQILSTAYAMIMMAVIVGTALQLGEDGIGSPSAIFLISLSSSFFIAACLHPQEFWCIVPGIIYLLSIPSMYLLLILYSIINLNVVSWGTREVQTKKTKKVRLTHIVSIFLSFSFIIINHRSTWDIVFFLW